MTTNTQQLEREIEKLIREHLAACRKAATAAVERAFSAVMNEPAPVKGPAKATSKEARPRRSPEELATLTEKLYDAMCATPGEIMAVLAEQLGIPSRSLDLPATRLKHAGRVRTVGKRQNMRYFPMAEDKPATETPLVAVERSV